MAFKFLLFSALLMATACGTTSNGIEPTGEKTYTVSGTILTHSPYCGGARPTPEIENGFNDPIQNADFYIYSGERPSNVKDMTKITTDEEGKFTVALPDGNYSLIQASKLLPLDEFIKLKKIDGDNYVNGDNECFQNWKNSADFNFSVTGADCSPLFTELKRCFTGANPCLDYVGPYPP